MTDIHQPTGGADLPPKQERDNRPAPAANEPAGASPTPHKIVRPRRLWLLGLGALLPLAAGVAYGAVQRTDQNHQVMRTTEHHRSFVPTVRVATARASDSDEVISLPATTPAFAQANIFARTNGYIEKREVD